MRRRRTVAEQALLAYKLHAPVRIRQTKADAAALDRAREIAQIRAVRIAVFTRSPNCQLCHGARVAECLGLPDQMHEDPPRSATRGLPPHERWNSKICGRLCVACHHDVTVHRVRIVFMIPSLGFMGPVQGELI